MQGRSLFKCTFDALPLNPGYDPKRPVLMHDTLNNCLSTWVAVKWCSACAASLTGYAS